MPIPEFKRVKDKATGHESSVRYVRDGQQVIDKPAVNADGKPLPAKPNVSATKRAATKEEADSSVADNPKEGSKK